MILPKGRDIRKELEEQEAFQNAERQRAETRAGVTFDSFVDSSPASIELFAADGRPLKSNKAAERLLGKVPPPGFPLFEPSGLKRAGLLEPQLKRVLAGARVETPPYWYDPTELGLPGTPGRKVCCRSTVFPVFDHEGSVARIAVMHEDLSEQKKLEAALEEARSAAVAAPCEPAAPPAGDARDIEFARRKIEQALREADERYRALVEAAKGYAIVRLTDDGRILALSPTIADLTGISRDAIMADNSLLFAQVHAEDIARVKEVEELARRSGEYPSGHHFRFTHRTTDATVWVELRGSATTFASRRTFELILLDVTAQKQTESLLAERDAGIARLLSSDSDAFFALDKDWIVTAWSPAAVRETRFASAETVGRRLWEIYPDLEKSGFALPFRKALLDREPQHKEGLYQDGRDRYAGWYAVSAYPFGSGLVVIVRNTTQRRKTEQAWQEADSRLRAVLGNPTVLVTFKDLNLRYVAANAAAERLLTGAVGGSVIGRDDADLFPATVTALLGLHDRQVIESGQPAVLELALGDPRSEATAWLNMTKQPWLSTGGESMGVVDISFDITRSVKSGQELARRREYVAGLLKTHADALHKAREELTRWAK